MKRVEVHAVVLVDDTQAAWVTRTEEGVDVLDAMENDVQIALTEPTFEGDDMGLNVVLERFDFAVTDVEP